MKEKTDNSTREAFSITMEEFDMLESTHVFSEKYQAGKKRAFREYRKLIYRPRRIRWAKAAAASFLFLTVPALAGMAANNGLFGRIWGTGGKENIESHREILVDERKGTAVMVTYPRREYTDAWLGQAEELIGSSISYGPMVKQIGDTKLSILASVYDGNAAVVAFSLEREGGVEGIVYGQLENEGKGAWFSPDAPFSLSFAEGSGSIFVDLEKSTKDKLYCYDYIAADFPNQGAWGLTLEIYYNRGEGQENQADRMAIPIREKVGSRRYCNAGGGAIDLSPLSMKVDMNTGLGLSGEQALDPWYAYYAEICYKDGINYLVSEHEVPGIHTSQVEIDNTGYTCGSAEGNLIFVFNRLVDVGNVESIIINETVYTPEDGG